MPNTPIMAAKREQAKYYGIEMMPSVDTPKLSKKAVFDIVQRRNTLKSRYLTAAFLYALRGVSYGIASRDFVRQVPPQSGCSPLAL